MLAVTVCTFFTWLCVATARDETLQSLRASNQSIQGRPFEAEDIQIGPFVLLDKRIPDINCPGQSVQYTHIIAKGDGTYRVPHSRIFMNGRKCGSLAANATEDELWVDSHMELFPIDFLFNETISLQKGTNAAWVKLRTHLQGFAFYNFSKTRRLNESVESQTWVGYERRGARVCGEGTTGPVVVAQGSFVFFGKNDNLQVNVSNLFPELNEGSIILRRIHPYHMMFQFIQMEEEGSGPSNETRQEVTCPLIFLDRTAREEAGEVRKCFPGNARVRRGDWEWVRMDELGVGDMVMDGSGGASEVYFFSHRDSETYGEFVRLFVSTNRSVTMSAGHYVYTPSGVVKAGDLRVGEKVLVEGGGVGVVEGVEWTVARGLYNPHTMSGGIVVEGVVASVYTDAVKAELGHGLLVPIRGVFRLLGRWRWMRRGLEVMMAGGGSVLLKSLGKGGGERFTELLHLFGN